MSDQAIYLFKAARRPLYLKENLHLLAGERGAIVEVAWNRSWVSSRFFDQGSIARGRQVCFIFTDRPYNCFVPVRAGEVVSSEWDDLMLRLRVSLRNHIGLDGMDVGRFTRLVQHASAGHCPGEKFVGMKGDDVEFVNFYDEREEEGWRRAVDEVLRMSAASESDPYRRSIFFRPAALRTGDEELASARRVLLEPGTRATLQLNFYNPHLDEAVMAEHRLRLLAPGDALRVEAPDTLPRVGAVEVVVEPLGPAELTIQVGPGAAQHTQVVERFRTRDEHAPGAGDASDPVDVARRREELLGLYDFVRRNAQFGPGDEVDFHERFATLLPDEQRIREEWGLLHYRDGAATEALRLLGGLDPERVESDDARFALFRLRINDDGAAHHMEVLGLSGEGRFPRLLDELAELGPAVLARVVPDLIESLPADQVSALVARVGDSIDSPDALVSMAQRLYCDAEDGTWVYRWLLERYRALRLATRSVEDTILDLASACGCQGDPDLDEIASRNVANLVERGELEEARSRLTVAAQALGEAERRRLYHRIAERLTARGRWADAAGLMEELCWLELGEGRPAEATDAISRARGFWEHTGEATPPELSASIAAVERAWKDLAPLHEWRTSEAERRRGVLRGRFLNQRLLIAGGEKNAEWVEYFSELTGAHIDWCRSHHTESDDLSAHAKRIENGHYAAVIHYLQRTGHNTAAVLKPAAQAAGVPWLDAVSAGRDGLEEALWRHASGAGPHPA
jgi:hypothetical protein